jgi:hypothetical protein
VLKCRAAQVIGEDGDLEKQRNDLDAERRAFSEATQRLGEERRRLEVSYSPHVPSAKESQLISVGRAAGTTRGKEKMGRWSPSETLDITHRETKVATHHRVSLIILIVWAVQLVFG